MYIVAAPNAFKDSLTAVQAADAIQAGVRAAFPHARVTLVPVADGGDGLTEVMLQGLGGKQIGVTVKGPRMQPVTAAFGLVAQQNLAVVEMAQASGLALLPAARRNPMETTTFGTGELIRAALEHGVARIIVGLGGSATCDGGVGMAAALGYRFLDDEGRPVTPVGGQLHNIAAIDAGGVDPRLATVRVEAACDVTNPLTGPQGAARVYGPQKGASAQQVAQLDAGLGHLAGVIARDLGAAITDLPGSGAAGGLGGGLVAFAGARLVPGIDLVLDAVGLADHLAGADLVLTAEGRMDAQTLFNKAPAGVARMARAAKVPCIALCGSVGEQIDALHDMGIDAIFSICDGPLALETAMAQADALLMRVSEQAVRAFFARR